jgi:hypothetical protein
MGDRVGSRLGQGLRLGSVRIAARRPTAGIYPGKGSGQGEYGSTAYPTIVESYNRDSDYKRWQLGQDLYFGSGRSWASYQIHSLARFINNSPVAADELDSSGSKEITTLFPSKTSSERAWYCSTRTRGSLILPAAIQSAAITLNTGDPDPSNHTLTYSLAGIYNSQQVAIYNSFIGDQFEDTASGPNYPSDLIAKPVGSVALTLIAVNSGGLTLTFDLSRPHVRVERNGHIYWQLADYDPSAPLSWKADGTRYLCSSFKFFCCCPDHLGGALANLEAPSERISTMDKFPLPNAARDVNSAWEREGVGYYRQWRTLPQRRDRRRECKHIHAMRWECGIPWLEPDDYPTSAERDWLELAGQQESTLRSEEILEYFRLRKLNWDRYVLTVGDTVGMTIFPGGDVRENIRPSPAPMLWNDGTQPQASWCRMNDWWMERGTRTLRIYNSGTQSFQSTVTKGGTTYDILTVLDADAPGAPVIVP